MRILMTLQYLNETTGKTHFTGREIFEASPEAMKRFGKMVRHYSWNSTHEWMAHTLSPDTPHDDHDIYFARQALENYQRDGWWDPWFWTNLCYADLHASACYPKNPYITRKKIDGLWNYKLSDRGFNWVCEHLGAIPF